MAAPAAAAAGEAAKLYIIVAFAAVIVGVGFPVWWKTTETYRVPLPYERIGQLSRAQWRFDITLNVIVPDATQWDVASLRAELDVLAAERNDTSAFPRDLLAVRYHVRRVDGEERKLIAACSTLEELARRWADMNTGGTPFSYDVVILPTAAFPPGAPVYITQRRLLFLREPSEIANVATEINLAAADTFAQKISLRDSFPSHHDQPNQKNKHELWAVRAAPVYDVTFSLVVPEPDTLRPRWNIERGIRDYLQPMMDKLSTVSSFNVQSQILYYLPLGVKPAYSQQTKQYYLTKEQLPHIINPLEEKLGSHITIHPSLHFIVYVPKRSESPLYIQDAAGQPSETNSFFSPRWGGIVIHNGSRVPENSEPGQDDVDVETTMAVVVSELRTFLGLNWKVDDASSYQKFDASSLSDWEVDLVVRQHTTEYLLTTANTLSSLSALLEEIENIVINDEVGNFVLDAMDAYEKCVSSLRRNLPEEALAFAKNAYVASEKAFFDPSMLALLYFPEDQKYAVYVPLFLPVSVPVLLSLFHVVSMWKKRRKSKQE